MMVMMIDNKDNGDDDDNKDNGDDDDNDDSLISIRQAQKFDCCCLVGCPTTYSGFVPNCKSCKSIKNKTFLHFHKNELNV